MPPLWSHACPLTSSFLSGVPPLSGKINAGNGQHEDIAYLFGLIDH